MSKPQIFIDENTTFSPENNPINVELNRVNLVNDDILSNKKAVGKAFRKSKKMKAPFFILKNDLNVIVAVRYKRRYKYLTSNQLATILVNYSKKINNIVFGEITDNLVKRSWEKYSPQKTGITINLENGIIIEKDKLDISIDFLASELANIFCKYGGLYELLEKIWTEKGIYRFTKISRKLSKDMTKKLLSRIAKLDFKKIGEKNVLSSETISSTKVKVSLDDESFFIVSASKNGVITSVVSHSLPGVSSEKMVLFEKEVENFIIDNSEEFVNKKFSWKGFFKYTIFALIIIAIFIFVFKIIYQDAAGLSLYSLAGNIINRTNRGIWFSVLSWTIFARVIGAWQLKRMLMMQNEKVKLRHVFISSLMSSVISFATPFAVGGDAIGYWYLRRKGFKRGPLAAAFISDTLLFQARFTLQTIILFSFGWPIYKEIFNSGTPEAHAALIMFIVGASWTIFATIMIFSLVLWRQFQEGIIRTSVRLLEWTRFVNIYDPEGVIAKYQYEFKQMRTGMKVVWGNFWSPLELLIYAMAPLFFDPYSLIMYFNGTIHHEIKGVNGYMATIVINDLVNTANSMSITPGGSGTAEWLAITTKKFIYDDSIVKNITTKEMASSIDFAYKMFYSWPWLLFSTLCIPTIIVLENRRRKLNVLNKNLFLNNKEAKHRTRLKFYFSILWFFIIVAFVVYFFLIF